MSARLARRPLFMAYRGNLIGFQRLLLETPADQRASIVRKKERIRVAPRSQVSCTWLNADEEIMQCAEETLIEGFDLCLTGKNITTQVEIENDEIFFVCLHSPIE